MATQRMHDRLSKWVRWLDDISDDILPMWFDEIRWRQLHEMAQDHGHIDGAEDFLGWFDGLYVQSMAVGIRRQAEVKPDSISLARLVTEVRDDPAVALASPWGAVIVGDK